MQLHILCEIKILISNQAKILYTVFRFYCLIIKVSTDSNLLSVLPTFIVGCSHFSVEACLIQLFTSSRHKHNTLIRPWSLCERSS